MSKEEEEIVDEFAIGFIYFIINNGYHTWNKGQTWSKDTFPPKEYTTTKLLEIYKQGL